MPTQLPTVKQTSETRDYLAQKIRVQTSFIGADDEIATLASEQKKGAHFKGLGSEDPNSFIESSVTEKIASDRSKWTVNYTIYTEHGTVEISHFTVLDTMQMAQYQFPLYRYLSPDEAAAVAAWENLDMMKPEQLEHKKNFEYPYDTEADGTLRYNTLTTVSERADAVARKLFAGVENVQKSYPQITRTSRFSARKRLTDRLNALNHIDANAPALISGYSWLKTQFDWAEQEDETWVLTEAWMGIPDNDPWDADLYGEHAWDFYKPGKSKLK